jgi:hypothetical protein
MMHLEYLQVISLLQRQLVKVRYKVESLTVPVTTWLVRYRCLGFLMTLLPLVLRVRIRSSFVNTLPVKIRSKDTTSRDGGFDFGD